MELERYPRLSANFREQNESDVLNPRFRLPLKLETLMSSNNNIEPLITLDEAAVVLDITPRALRDMRYRGGGPAFYKLNSIVLRYKMSEVIEWRDGCRDAGGEL